MITGKIQIMFIDRLAFLFKTVSLFYSYFSPAPKEGDKGSKPITVCVSVLSWDSLVLLTQFPSARTSVVCRSSRLLDCCFVF